MASCLAGCSTDVKPSTSTVTIPDLRNPCDGAACAPATAAPYPANAAALPTLGLETLAGELGRANNTWDAGRRRAVLHVVVPDGLTLASTVVPERIGKAYDVTVTADGPSRWVVALAAQ